MGQRPFRSCSFAYFSFVFIFSLFSFILMLVTLGVLFRLFHIIFSRSHLREIRDRSVLRLFESNEVTAPQALPGGTGVPQPLPQNAGGHWDQDQVSSFRWKEIQSIFIFCDFSLIVQCHPTQTIRIVHDFSLSFHLQSYFSEPEFDTEYQHQHVHKSKVSRFFLLSNEFNSI